MFQRNNRDNKFSGGRGGKKFGGGKSFGGGRGGSGGGFSKRGFGGGRDSGRFELHKAICSECGKPCQVPFKPSGDKPVFCNDCFKNPNSRSGKNFDRNDRYERNDRFDRDNRDDRFDRNDRENDGPRLYDAVCDECGDPCKVPFKPSGDKPVLCDYCFKYAKNERGSKDDEMPTPKAPKAKGNDSYKEQFEMLNIKLDRILKFLDVVAAEKNQSLPALTDDESSSEEESAGIDPFGGVELIGQKEETSPQAEESAEPVKKPRKKKAKKQE